MTSKEVLKNQVAVEMHQGDYLAAFDDAEQALKDFPHDEYFRHAAVLSLARTGALEQEIAQQFDRKSLDQSVQPQRPCDGLRGRR